MTSLKPSSITSSIFRFFIMIHTHIDMLKHLFFSKIRGIHTYFIPKCGRTRVPVAHTAACTAGRNWSAWKHSCKAECAAMTLGHIIERIIVAEYYSGR